MPSALRGDEWPAQRNAHARTNALGAYKGGMRIRRPARRGGGAGGALCRLDMVLRREEQVEAVNELLRLATQDLLDARHDFFRREPASGTASQQARRRARDSDRAATRCACPLVLGGAHTAAAAPQ